MIAREQIEALRIYFIDEQVSCHYVAVEALRNGVAIILPLFAKERVSQPDFRPGHIQPSGGKHGIITTGRVNLSLEADGEGIRLRTAAP